MVRKRPAVPGSAVLASPWQMLGWALTAPGMRVRKRMRRLATILAVAVLALAMEIPAGAITSGELDGNGHPYVGLMVAQDKAGNPL